MNELMSIRGQNIAIKEYQGQRVVTFRDIDQVHGRPEGTARKRFLMKIVDTLLTGQTSFLLPSRPKYGRLG